MTSDVSDIQSRWIPLDATRHIPDKHVCRPKTVSWRLPLAQLCFCHYLANVAHDHLRLLPQTQVELNKTFIIKVLINYKMRFPIYVINIIILHIKHRIMCFLILGSVLMGVLASVCGASFVSEMPFAFANTTAFSQHSGLVSHWFYFGVLSLSRGILSNPPAWWTMYSMTDIKVTISRPGDKCRVFTKDFRGTFWPKCHEIVSASK